MKVRAFLNQDYSKKRHLSNSKLSTRLKSFLRFFLPLKAILLLISIIFWPSLRVWLSEPSVPYTAQEVLGEKVHNTASRPQLNGVDRQNQPYLLVADYMIQTEEGNLELSLPCLTLDLKSGNKITLRANKAYLNQKENLVHLLENVVLTHSTGYEFQTSQTWINLNTMEAFGKDPVKGQGPAGLVHSTSGFQLTEKGDKIKFLGRPELTILD